MHHHFRGRDFLKLADFTPEEVDYIIDTAVDLKRKRATGEIFEPLRGKTVAILFEKKSTRTRVSFQAAIAQLGAQSFFCDPTRSSSPGANRSRTRRASLIATVRHSSFAPSGRRSLRSLPSTWKTRLSTP